MFLDDQDYQLYLENLRQWKFELGIISYAWRLMTFTKSGHDYCYQEYLPNTIPRNETELISKSLQRNQLTGNNRFVDEIEGRIGFRVGNKGRGRPQYEEK